MNYVKKEKLNCSIVKYSEVSWLMRQVIILFKIREDQMKSILDTNRVGIELEIN